MKAYTKLKEEVKSSSKSKHKRVIDDTSDKEEADAFMASMQSTLDEINGANDYEKTSESSDFGYFHLHEDQHLCRAHYCHALLRRDRLAQDVERAYKKQKTAHYCADIVIKIEDQYGNIVLIRGLCDTGTSSSILLRKYIQKGQAKSYKGQCTQWSSYPWRAILDKLQGSSRLQVSRVEYGQESHLGVSH